VLLTGPDIPDGLARLTIYTGLSHAHFQLRDRRLKAPSPAVPLDRPLGTSAMEIIIFLPIFIAGLGCGYYARDRLFSKRRGHYLSSTRDHKNAKPHLLDFKTIRMSDVWRALRNLHLPQ
jgi:hypothetical protein